MAADCPLCGNQHSTKWSRPILSAPTGKNHLGQTTYTNDICEKCYNASEARNPKRKKESKKTRSQEAYIKAVMASMGKRDTRGDVYLRS
jgi:hypothetical protein